MTAIKKPYNPVTVIERMIDDYTASGVCDKYYDPDAATRLGSRVCRFCPHRTIQHLTLNHPYYQEYKYYQHHPNFTSLAELDEDTCCLLCKFSASFHDSVECEYFSCYVPVSHLYHISDGNVTYKGTKVVLDWEHYIVTHDFFVADYNTGESFDLRDITENICTIPHDEAAEDVNTDRRFYTLPQFKPNPEDEGLTTFERWIKSRCIH